MAWIESYQTDRGIHYRVGWWEGGKRRYKTTGSLKKFAIKERAKIEARATTAAPVSYLQVSECVREYLKVMGQTEGIKASTARIARTELAHFLKEFGTRIIHEIKAEEVERWKNRLLDTKVSNGVNFTIRNVKTLFEFCVRSGYIEINPLKPIKQFKVKPVYHFLTRKELSLLYKSASKKLRRVIFVLYKTGLRLGELLGVTPVDILEDAVIVKGVEGDKTGARQVPVDPRVRQVFTGIAGKLNRNTVEGAFRKAVKLAGISRMRPHDLRHTWASAYLKNGGTLDDLQRRGGWKNLSSLQIYVHFQQDQTKRMVKIKL